MIFTSPDKEREWQELPQNVKDYAKDHLSQFASKMENRLAIEMLCHVINELDKRIQVLEKRDTPCS